MLTYSALVYLVVGFALNHIYGGYVFRPSDPVNLLRLTYRVIAGPLLLLVAMVVSPLLGLLWLLVELYMKVDKKINKD